MLSKNKQNRYLPPKSSELDFDDDILKLLRNSKQTVQVVLKL